MAIEMFGFTLGKSKKPDVDNLDRISTSKVSDGALEVDSNIPIDFAGSNSYIFDFEREIKNESEQIDLYREIAELPDVDAAVQDIVNEAVVVDDTEDVVSLELDETGWSASIQTKIKEEFEFLLGLLNFNTEANVIFQNWYVDGKQYYHKVVNDARQKEGIQELNWLDPSKTKKIRENIIKHDHTKNVDIIIGVREFYLYDPTPRQHEDKSQSGQPYFAEKKQILKINSDAIAYSFSGIIDRKTGRVKSYLHKAIKSANQLSMIEDSMVVYRLVKAPERRIFYVDVGNLSKTKAEAYIKSLMLKYRNKQVYDIQTGKPKDQKNHLSMMEDIWLPRKEGSKGTAVDTLQGGQHLDEIEDVIYFRKKLYKALNIPLSRLEQETMVNIGQTSEITREELKLTKFVDKLITNFNKLLYDILRTQLILKSIITEEDWDDEIQNIKLVYNKDSYFSELKDAEIMTTRLEILASIENFVGKFFSVEWVQENVLKMNEDERDTMEKQIEEEKKKFADDPLAPLGYVPDQDYLDAQNVGDEEGDEEDNGEEKQQPPVNDKENDTGKAKPKVDQKKDIEKNDKTK